jgi:hypothetical protein
MRPFALTLAVCLISSLGLRAESVQPSNPAAAKATLAAPAKVEPQAPAPVAGESKAAPQAAPAVSAPASAPAAAPKSETSAAEDQKQESPEPSDEKKPQASSGMSSGSVAPLRDLAMHYETEGANVRKMMDRWNARFAGVEQRAASLRADQAKLEEEIAAKKTSSDKRERKEASRLEKQLGQFGKTQKALNKERVQLTKDLQAEIKQMGKDAQNALKEKFSLVLQDVKASQ